MPSRRAPGDSVGQPVEDRKREIQLIAADLFRQRGYDGVSVRDLAQAAGITVPTLYWYIGSKPQLLVDLLESVYADAVERYGAVCAMDAPADEKFREFLRTGFDLVGMRGIELAVVTHERHALDGERRGRLAPLRREMDAALRAILVAGKEEGLWGDVSLESTRLAVWSLLVYAISWFNADGPKSPRELADNFADIMLNGLRLRAGD
jgi:AcrR family transcriptional regulator